MKATDKGIFLQRTTYSDSSLIVTFFTLKGGLQKFIFRGGKKKAHNVFPMSVSELSYYGRKESELLNLTSVESVRPQTFQFDPVKGAIAFFMAETLRKCIAPGQEDPDFFTFIERTVLDLENKENVTLFPLEFLINCSEALGFKPLCDDPSACVFNLDAGVFQMSSSAVERTYRGVAVELIKELVQSGSSAEAHEKTERKRLWKLCYTISAFTFHVSISWNPMRLFGKSLGRNCWA